jgi:hypothetical protein
LVGTGFGKTGILKGVVGGGIGLGVENELLK